MKVKKLFTGLLITSLTTLSGLQLLASTTGNEIIKTNIVYTATDPSPETTTETDLNAFYNEKGFKILENYFNITRDQLPKDAKFIIFVMTKESLAQEEAHWLELCEQEYAQKKLTKQEYTTQKEDLKKQYDGYRNQLIEANHDIVTCQLYLGINSPNAFYSILFNANTKEAYEVTCPYSEEGWNLQCAVVDGKKPSSASEATDQIKTANGIQFITTHQIADIKNPKIVIIKGSTHNRIYYEDASDPNKKVLLFFDPVTNKVIAFNSGHDAAELS